jgi:hypothetical protein
MAFMAAIHRGYAYFSLLCDLLHYLREVPPTEMIAVSYNFPEQL